jgi:glycine/D-amino acid oxidase-like deaminating enzyme/nitrite reductase/ring-hydroxylating ferredoxin subunit
MQITGNALRSVWMDAREAPTFGTAREPMDVDAIVVGGGMTGLTTALVLSDAGQRVALLEAGAIGAGNTGRSTGNLYGTVSQGLQKLRGKWDAEIVREMVAMRMAAVDLVEATVQRFGIDCAFARVPLHACVTKEDAVQLASLEAEYEALAEAGLAPQWRDDVPGLPSRVVRALRVEGQAQLNPYLYARGLASALSERGVHLFERSPVVDIDAGDGLVRTADAELRAATIVIATHSPIGFNLVQAEMEPSVEYGVAARLDHASAPEGICWVRDASYSVRRYRHDGGDYLVVVGEKHKTGEPEPGADYLERLRGYVRDTFGLEHFTHAWSAQQFHAADDLPYVGPSAHRNVFIATGFAADGLTWGTAAATILGDLIQGRSKPAGERLTPRRFTPAKSAKTWADENIAVVRHLVGDRLRDAEIERLSDVGQGEGRIVEIDGRKFATYRDPRGRLSVLSPVCPHLKCHVRWNAASTSWDCPCHGSRFHPDGRVMDGPAMTPLERYPLAEDEQENRPGA